MQAATPVMYEIRVSGLLAPNWGHSLEGLTVIHQTGDTTVLRGRIVDQAALYGILIQARDAGLTLLGVIRLDTADLSTATGTPG
jgi:hypothetical protein